MKLPTPQKSAAKKTFDPTKVHEAYLARIEKDIEKSGVKMFVKDDNIHVDEDYLSIPEDVTVLSSRDLGNTLNAFTQQKMWYRTVLCRAENLEEISRRLYFEKSSSAYYELSSKKYSETAKERIINSMEDVKPYYEDWKDCQRKCSIVRAAIANIEDAIFLLSREVTRRGADYNEENRSYNVEGTRA